MALDKYRMQKTITHLVGGATVVLGGMFILQTAVRILVDNSALVAVEVGRFEAPIALVGRPGTQDLLLGERRGIVRRINLAADGSFSPGEEVLDISGEVTTEGEGGLVGLAISPTGDQLYVSYTDRNWLSRIVSYGHERRTCRHSTTSPYRCPAACRTQQRTSAHGPDGPSDHWVWRWRG